MLQRVTNLVADAFSEPYHPVSATAAGMIIMNKIQTKHHWCRGLEVSGVCVTRG
jgi:hypothetical protein